MQNDSKQVKRANSKNKTINMKRNEPLILILMPSVFWCLFDTACWELGVFLPWCDLVAACDSGTRRFRLRWEVSKDSCAIDHETAATKLRTLGGLRPQVRVSCCLSSYFTCSTGIHMYQCILSNHMVWNDLGRIHVNELLFQGHHDTQIITNIHGYSWIHWCGLSTRVRRDRTNLDLD